MQTSDLKSESLKPLNDVEQKAIQRLVSKIYFVNKIH